MSTVLVSVRYNQMALGEQSAAVLFTGGDKPELLFKYPEYL